MIARQATFGIVRVAGLFVLAHSALSYAADGPAEWLDRMSNSIKKTNYAGTVVRTRGGEAEALKVARRIKDGVINEKVTIQEGSKLEIIRSGDEVHCILPEQKSVLVETWDDQSTLFSMLPGSEIIAASEYDVSIVREDRVAGRNAVLLAIRPHDHFRFAHRVWLDSATAFPLQTEVIGLDGSVLEQIKFADINLETQIPADAFSPSVSLDNFTWHGRGAQPAEVDVDSDWICDDLPAGFRVVSTKTERLSGADNPVTHIRYSDGIASVSVFIAQGEKRQKPQRSNIWGSNAYSLQNNGYQITAVGEVPAVTVQRIATSMRQR